MNIMRNIWTTYRLWQFNDRCFQNPGRVPRGARRRVVWLIPRFLVDLTHVRTKGVKNNFWSPPTIKLASIKSNNWISQVPQPTWIGLDWRTWLQLDLLCYILADLVSSSPSNNQMSCGWSFQASPQCKAECLAWPQATFGEERSICWSLMLCLTIFWKLHILCLKLWNW